MIHKIDATMTRFACDACDKTERVYETHGPDGPLDRTPDYPEGWKTWPEYSVMGKEIKLLLCPEHAALIPVVKLVEKLVKTEERVDG